MRNCRDTATNVYNSKHTIVYINIVVYINIMEVLVISVDIGDSLQLLSVISQGLPGNNIIVM